MGTMLYSKGVFVNRCFESLNLTAARPGRRSPPRLRARRRRRHRNQHLRRQPRQARRRSAWPTRCARSTSRGRASRVTPPASRPTSPARSGRSASASSRGARPAWTRPRSTSASRRGAARGAGRPLHPRDVPRPERDGRRHRRRARRCATCPIVAQMAIEEHGNTLDGTPPEKFGPGAGAPRRARRGRQLQRRPRARCSRRSSGSRRPSKRRSPRSPTPASPGTSRGARSTSRRPEYMASYARRFSATGVRLVGGCCGTTPEHIRQMKLAVGAGAPPPGARPRGAVSPRDRRGSRRCPPVPREQKSRLAHAIARGTFVHLVELTPPKGHEFAADDRGGARAEDPRRGCDQHPGRSAGGGADERGLDGRADRAAGGDRNGAPLRLPRPEPARHGVGPARRARDGHPERPAGHRRPAPARRLRVRHGCLRRGLDRSDQRRQPPEPRRGHRRRAALPPDGVSHRRGGQPDRARTWTTRCGASSSRSRRAPSSRSPSPSSTSTRSTSFLRRIAHLRCRSSPGSGRSTASSTPSSWRTRCPACACPDELAAPDAPHRHAGGGGGRRRGDCTRDCRGDSRPRAGIPVVECHRARPGGARGAGRRRRKARLSAELLEWYSSQSNNYWQATRPTTAAERLNGAIRTERVGPDGRYISSSDAATRALSVTAVENDFVEGVYGKLAVVYDWTFGPTLHPGRLQAIQRMGIQPDRPDPRGRRRHRHQPGAVSPRMRRDRRRLLVVDAREGAGARAPRRA